MITRIRVMLLAACAALVSGCCVFGVGCKATPTAQTAAQAIKGCAGSDVLPSTAIMYTGPTGAGPGSFWVAMNGNQTEFVIGAIPADIFGSPVPQNIYAPPSTDGACAFSSSATTEVKLNLGADLKTLPLSASAETDLKDATVIDVTADGFQWESVKYLVYNAQLSSSQSARAYFKPNVWVAIGMLKVRNYVANLDVSKVQNVDLSAKYNGPLGGAMTGNLSGGVTASYNGSGKLKLTIPGETYVAGVFRPLNPASGQVESSHVASTSPVNWNPTPVQIMSDRK
jgi:hypothetical protein